MTEFRILDKAQITLTVICGKIKNQVDFFGDMVYISSKEQRVLEEYVKIAHEEAQKNEIKKREKEEIKKAIEKERIRKKVKSIFKFIFNNKTVNK